MYGESSSAAKLFQLSRLNCSQSTDALEQGCFLFVTAWLRPLFPTGDGTVKGEGVTAACPMLVPVCG